MMEETCAAPVDYCAGCGEELHRPITLGHLDSDITFPVGLCCKLDPEVHAQAREVFTDQIADRRVTWMQRGKGRRAAVRDRDRETKLRIQLAEAKKGLDDGDN